MIKFIKENWFKLSILFLSAVLVLFISNYIWVATNTVVKKNNFSLFKFWFESEAYKAESGEEILDNLNEKYGL